jgi:hypothetical protein
MTSSGSDSNVYRVIETVTIQASSSLVWDWQMGESGTVVDGWDFVAGEGGDA